MITLRTYSGIIRFWTAEEGGRTVALKACRYAAQLKMPNGICSVVLLFAEEAPPLGCWSPVTVLSRFRLANGDHILAEGSRPIATLSVRTC